MSDFAEIVTVAVTSVMAVFLFVVITPLIYVHLLVVRISKVAGMYFPAVVYTV